jgi:tetratricopeptide (TPR) repeat protein
MPDEQKLPELCRFYKEYLSDEDSARFVTQVSTYYSIGTLERLAEFGSRIVRRSATLSLGFLGEFESNAVMGGRLNDVDRGVRVLAENGIRELWCRDGDEVHRQQLRNIMRLNASNQCEEAVVEAGLLIDAVPFFAEAWNQRAIALYQIGEYVGSVNDCQQTLELNPFHFGAAVGMAHGYLELDDAFAALKCFRQSLAINPSLDGVRSQIHFLERSLEER